ncbi:MFS transporter [Pontibacillus yanchengensis]|uniref:MFS transporter n=1 Tax=Pontibacillus yanchengensis TaxID=462910 RepID=A0ACC7VIP7_9BACI|nr:MFS transporter [Pontibacillus yanchengensis]MYL54657.1 MFS transporter [Pontibacillus yanchengensis]
MRTNDVKRYFQFALIVLAGGSIFPLIYLRTNYQETILDVFGITLPQLNIILSALGIAYVVGYFPSGWLADRFSAKKLLSISLLGVGLGGIWFAQVPSYPYMIAIFCVWGIFSVLTFWSAHIKLVKLISKKEEEGRLFGILDGGKGVVEAVLASIAVAIFSAVLGSSTAIGDKTDALVSVIYMYSLVLIVVSILIMIFVNVDEPSAEETVNENEGKKKSNVSLEAFKKVFANRLVILLGFIIFMAYIVAWTVYYVGGFLQTNIGISASAVGTVTVVMLWMRPIGGTLGGFLGDKFGKSFILTISLILATVALFVTALLPSGLPHMYFYILILLIGLGVYSIRGLYWSLLGDCNIDKEVLGLSIGFVSLIGYLPDIVLPLVVSGLMSTFGDSGGYNAYFIFSGVAGIAAIIFTVMFGIKTKKNMTVTQEDETASL